MFTHKMFNLVLRSLAVVFIIAISVPFSSSSAPAKGKGIFCDDGSTFEMGEATAFPFDTVEVPVKFRGMRVLWPVASTSTDFRRVILCRRGRWCCSGNLVRYRRNSRIALLSN